MPTPTMASRIPQLSVLVGHIHCLVLLDSFYRTATKGNVCMNFSYPIVSCFAFLFTGRARQRTRNRDGGASVYTSYLHVDPQPGSSFTPTPSLIGPRVLKEYSLCEVSKEAILCSVI
jgi:hypothetical protein